MEHPSHARYELVTDAPAEAPWMTMVHGVSQDHRVFDRQVDAFRQAFRIILIDMPGHGLSTDLPGPYGLQEYATSISGALDDAGVVRSHFWGTHLSAGAGLFLACHQPERFSSLVLEGPVFPGRALPAVATMLAKVSDLAKTKGMEAAHETWWQKGGWFDVIRQRPDECRAAAHRAIVSDFQGQPWLDPGLASRPITPIDTLLAALPIPVLIVNGEHELPDFIDAADALEAVIPDVQRAAIKDGGGFPLWEFPERTAEVVHRFLADKRSQKSSGSSSA